VGDAGGAGKPGRRRAGAPDAGARESILAAAALLFRRKGYAATAVREIVERAGVTKPVLYYYFRNKEGLFRAIMRESRARFEALLREGGGGVSARERLHDLAARLFALVRERAEVARLVYALYYGPGQGAPPVDVDGYRRRFREAVLGAVKEGIRTGEFRRGDPHAMAWAVIGGINVVIERFLCERRGRPGQADLRRVLEAVFAGLAPGPGAAQGANRRRGRKVAAAGREP